MLWKGIWSCCVTKKCGVLAQEHGDYARESRGLVQRNWRMFAKIGHMLTDNHKATNVPFIKQHMSIYKPHMFLLGRCHLPPVPWLLFLGECHHFLGCLQELMSAKHTLLSESYINTFTFTDLMARLLSLFIQSLGLSNFKFIHIAQLHKDPCYLWALLLL